MFSSDGTATLPESATPRVVVVQNDQLSADWMAAEADDGRRILFVPERTANDPGVIADGLADGFAA